eukprot:GHVT01096918.1.p1 GENE.GHVT01096918.1~~GHVT01096918.1.p1  ORF type:complete len:737 (-),score=166.33 GHVT01096918.1:959-3169(-)
MSIFFRFTSERGGSFHEVPIPGSLSSISVGDLKVLVAERTGLSSEFARRLDLLLYPYVASSSSASSSSATGSPPNLAGVDSASAECGAEYVDDNQLIPLHSRVLVARVPLSRTTVKTIQHKARFKLSSKEWMTADERWLDDKNTRPKRALPLEWVCAICESLLRDPQVFKCLCTCNILACAECVDAHIKAHGPTCPVCGKPSKQTVRNRRLADVIAASKLQDFHVPDPKPVQQKQQQQQQQHAATGTRDRRGSLNPSGTAPTSHPPSTTTSTEPGSANNARAANDGRSHPGVKNEKAFGETEASNGARNQETRRESSGAPYDANAKVEQTEAQQLRVETEEEFEGLFPTRFVYLMPVINLNLLRRHDLLVADVNSSLAQSLAVCSSPSFQFSIVPVAAAAGGLTMAVGGVCQVCPSSHVDSSTNAAADVVVRRWVGARGENGVTPGEVYRVTWSEKFPQMPSVPYRRQPLCGLLSLPTPAAALAVAAGTLPHSALGSANGMSSLRTLVGSLMEVVVDSCEKFDELVASICDYVATGSRHTELSSAGASPDAPPPASAPPFLPRATVSSVHRQPAERDRAGGGSAAVAGRQGGGSSRPCGDHRLLPGGPEPLDTDGKPLARTHPNPYLGYTALLPFLTRHQFKKIRRLQTHAKTLAKRIVKKHLKLIARHSLGATKVTAVSPARGRQSSSPAASQRPGVSSNQEKLRLMGRSPSATSQSFQGLPSPTAPAAPAHTSD